MAASAGVDWSSNSGILCRSPREVMAIVVTATDSRGVVVVVMVVVVVGSGCQVESIYCNQSD